MKNPLVEKFGEQIRWVNWRLEERKGKKTKIPYRPNSARMASSTDPKTWGTYKQAYDADPKHVGITFTPERTLLGIDIDHCIEWIGADKKEWRWASDEFKFLRKFLVEDCRSYVEVSPSGTGLHIFFELTVPVKLEANRHGNYECYTDGRYFTFTGNPFGEMEPVRAIDDKETLAILSKLGYPWKEKPQPLPTVVDEVGEVTPKQWNSLESKALLERIFAASNGEEIKKLYDGDATKYGGDASRADAALLSHLAFWTQKNAGLMETIWLESPAGKREKVQKRQDYRTRSINAAIMRCGEVYNPNLRGASEVSLEEMALLYYLKDKTKIYYKNTENMTRVIQKHPDFAGTFRFDNYRSAIERRIGSTWRNLEDHDAVEIQTRISVLFSDFAHVGKEMIYDAIIKVARDNQIDSGADYIKSLTWDGVPRLDTWLHTVYGTPSDEYHKKVGGNWLKGMVKRVIMPGCKFDYVLVLEGKQGIKKSTSLDVLAGELGHVETTISTEQKDFFLLMQGNAIIEFSEGETLSRTEVKQLKSVISTGVDKYRAPYGRATMAHPRRCVFAMTTNQSEYLKDETGNRRWLPVAVEKPADLEWLQENREQLFAEAYLRVITKNETVHEFPEEELEAAQVARRIKDPNIDVIVNWYWSQPPSHRKDGFSVADVYINALHGGFMTKPMSRNDEMSIADVMRTWLRLESKQIMTGGMRSRRYFPTPQTDTLQPSPENMPARQGITF